MLHCSAAGQVMQPALTTTSVAKDLKRYLFSLKEGGNPTLGLQQRSVPGSKILLSFVNIVVKLKTAEEFRAENKKPARVNKLLVAMAGEDQLYVNELTVNWDRK